MEGWEGNNWLTDFDFWGYYIVSLALKLCTVWSHCLAIKLEAVRKHYCVCCSVLLGLLWHGRSRKTLTQRKFTHYCRVIWALMSPLLSVKNKWVGLNATTFAEFAKQLCTTQHKMCYGKKVEIYGVKMGATKCRMTTLLLERISAPWDLCLISPWQDNLIIFQFFASKTWGVET